MNLKIDRDLEIPVGEQLATQIKLLICTRELAPEEQLPTIKELAASLNLNYNTVAEAYRKLERQGYVVQNRRAGTHVAAKVPADPTTQLVAHMTAGMARRFEGFDAHPSEITKMLAANLALNLRRPLSVAVLASSQAEATEAAVRVQAILGDGFSCVPKTANEYSSVEHHLSVLSPELASSLAALSSPAPLPSRAEAYSAAFPAGAD